MLGISINGRSLSSLLDLWEVSSEIWHLCKWMRVMMQYITKTIQHDTLEHQQTLKVWFVNRQYSNSCHCLVNKLPKFNAYISHFSQSIQRLCPNMCSNCLMKSACFLCKHIRSLKKDDSVLLGGGAVEFTFVGITMFINPMGRSTSLVAIVILKHPLSSLELHVQDIPYTIHI